MQWMFSLVTATALLIGLNYFFTVYPGLIEIQWLDYNLSFSVAIGLICIATLYIIITFLILIIRKVLNLPKFFSAYRRDKLNQKMNDQLWTAYQNIKFNHLPFPQQTLERLIYESTIDPRIPLDLLIANCLKHNKEISEYLHQLKQYSLTQPSYLYAEIAQLRAQNKIDRCLDLYPKLINIVPSDLLKQEYMELLLEAATSLIKDGRYDQAYINLQHCDLHFLYDHQGAILCKYVELMCQYYLYKDELKKVINLIEETWPYCHSLNLFDLYKKGLNVTIASEVLSAAQRLASFAPEQIMSFQIVIENAIQAKIWGIAKKTLTHFQQCFPSNELMRTYQSQLSPYLNPSIN